MQNSHKKLWAKSADWRFSKEGESLFQHSFNVAQNTQMICKRLPFSIQNRESITKSLIEAGTFHDIGKAASGFQRMLREKDFRWGHRHETLSTALACILNPNLDETALFAILTHHRNIPPSRTSGEKEKCLPICELPPSFGATGDDSEWQKILSELQENWTEFEYLISELRRELNLEWQNIEAENDFLKLGLDKKWLNRDYQKKISAEQRWQASLMRGLLITSDHLASAVDPKTGEHPKIPDIPDLSDFEAKIKENELPENAELLPFQQRTFETKGNVILKAPTGSGKTLAALLWATNNQTENGRFFYALPFTASINAMADRFKKIFKKDEFDNEYVGVLHHRNADYLFRMMENDELSVKLKNEQAKHLKSLAKEMYHPIRICTPHQILRFALRGRGWETGLAEFTNGCIVFDEIHAFEPLIAGLTLATAKLLQSEPFNARILFASATIPKFLENLIKENLGIPDENIIEPNPFDAKDKIVCEKKRHKIEVRQGSLFENLGQIISEIKQSGEETLIFCNHVKTSQQIFDELEGEGFRNLTLLHSRFNGHDRNEIEDKITKKKTKEDKAKLKELIKQNSLFTPILVATQAVEVSLDIDYERGYSEPAPADALGQRLGRVNRKGSRSAANIIVFEEPTNGYLYDETLTNKTVELLKNVDGELSEKELTDIVDQVYENGYPPSAESEFKKGLKNDAISNFADEIIAGTHVSWTDEIIDKSDGQIEVLPYSLFKKYKELKEDKRFIEVRQLLVPIRLGQFHKAKKMDAVLNIEKLREPVLKLAYSTTKGLDFDRLDDSNFC